MFKRLFLLLAPVLFGAPVPAMGQACQLCSPGAGPKAPAAPARPLHIDIETSLDFSTAAHTDAGSGTIALDSRTGARTLSGLVGVGGPALRGFVTVTGEPFRHVVISVPQRVRLNSTMGAKADVTGIQTTLPPDAVLGPDGKLTFHFGGKFTVIDDAAGEFHGRIQISVDYQ